MASKALVSGTALLMSLIILWNGIAEADSYCETFTYSDQPVVLAVPEEYYARPRRADSMISLMVRYKDLTAPPRLRDGYDASELADPTWTLARSNYTALLRSTGMTLSRPARSPNWRNHTQD